MQRGEQRGVAEGLDAGHLIEDEAEMRRAALRGDFDGLFREGEHAHGIALLRGDVGKRAGEFAGVVEACGSGGAEVHAAAGVDEQAETQVRVGLKFLDVKAVAAPPGAPVEAPCVIAGDVLAVLREFERGTANGAAVLAGDVAEHGLAGVQGQRHEAGEDRWVEE